MRVIAGLAGAAALALLCASARADNLRTPSEEYPTIQDALNAAGAGDVVVIAPGTYTQSFSIGPEGESMRPGFTVRGSGRVVLEGVGISIYYTDGMRIQNLTIVDAIDEGIYADECPNLSISRVIIRNAEEDGIQLSYSDGSTIRNCRILDCDGPAISDYSSDELLIDRCVLDGWSEGGEPVFEGPGSYDGIELSPYSSSGNGSNSAVITRNRILHSSAGIRGSGADMRIQGNRIENFNYTGIYIEGSNTSESAKVYSYSGGANSDRAFIQGNRVISGNGSYGIYVYADESVIEGNMIGDDISWGIYTQGNNGTIAANRVMGGYWAIYADGSSNFVGGNWVEFAYGGIYLTDGTDCAVEGNRVLDADNVGIQIYVYNTDIHGNTVLRCGGTGFYVGNSVNSFRRNVSQDSGSWDLYDQYQAGQNVYTRNLFGSVYFGGGGD